MDVTHPGSLDLSDYLGLVRRHWWVVLVLTALGVAGAAAVTRTMPREYVSSTSVLVQPSGGDTNAAGGRTKGEINLDTEAQLVRSTQVATGAAELLRSGVDGRELARSVSVEVPPNTTVLQIKYAASTPKQAQAGSHAFAESYLRSRESNAQADLTGQTKALDTKLKQLNKQLTTIVAKLGKASSDAANRGALDSQRTTVQTQINQLNSKLNQLSTATVSAGRIISDAGLPSRPRKPDLKINLAGGALLGALLGLLLAAIRHRLDRRVRRAADVARRADVAGRMPLAAAVQRAPRTPHLRVLATGATASAAGLLQSQALCDIVAQLRSQCDYLVIEAPSTATSADAQSLAGVADAAIVAVELRRTRYPQIVDAAEQLRRVGTLLLGAVVGPKLPHRETPSQPHVRPTPAMATAETDPSDSGEPAADTQLMQRLDDETLAVLDAAAASGSTATTTATGSGSTVDGREITGPKRLRTAGKLGEA